MATDIVVKKYRNNTWDVVYPRANWNNIENKPSTFTPSSHFHQYIKYNDTRNTETTPASAAAFDGIRIDFKRKVISHIPSTGDYTAEITMDAYADPSGGYPSQLGFSMSGLDENKRLYFRSPKTANEWGAWKTLAFTDDIPNIADWAKSSTKPSYSFSEITGKGEALLAWGGANKSGSFGPIDAALVPELGANRLAFMPTEAIDILYSRDGGVTWIDYEASNTTKSDLFNGRGTGITIGKSGGTVIATKDYQLKVIIRTKAANVYTVLNKFVILVSTSGTTNNWCTIRGRTEYNRTNNIDTWYTFANKATVSGWSGYNVINTEGCTTYGNTATSQYGEIQFIFGCDTGSTSSYTGLTIMKILGFGGVGWTTPSILAKRGTIYSYDSAQNATFPASLSAPTMHAGSGGTGSSDSSSNNKIAVYGGTVQINNYGKYVKIGNRNSAYAHFDTDVSQGFYFNKQMEINGSVLPYTNNNFNLGTLANRWKGIYANTVSAQLLSPATSRITSANLDWAHEGYDGICAARIDIATSSITDGSAPTGGNGFIQTFFWDNSSYDSQLYIPNTEGTNSGRPQIRFHVTSSGGTTWSAWKSLALLSDVPDVSAFAPKNSPVFSNKITIGATEIAPANTGDISLTLPAGDGQLALKEDLNSYLLKIGGTLSGTLDINTTNLNALSVKGLGAAILKVDGTHPSSGSDYLSIYATDSSNSTNRKIIIQNGYGDVGIGTSNPSAKLDVSGNLNATTIYENGTALTSKYLQTSGGTITGALNIENGDLANALKVKGLGNAFAKFDGVVATTDYFHIYATDSSGSKTRPLVLQNGYGNVGIGVVSPSKKLDVNGSFNATTIYENGVSLADKYQAKGSGGGGITLESQGKLVIEDGDMYFVNRTDFNFPVGNYIIVPTYDDSIGDDEHTYVGCVTACTRTGYVTFDAYNPIGDYHTYINIQDGDVASMSAGSYNCVFNIYRLV